MPNLKCEDPLTDSERPKFERPAASNGRTPTTTAWSLVDLEKPLPVKAALVEGE